MLLKYILASILCAAVMMQAHAQQKKAKQAIKQDAPAVPVNFCADLKKIMEYAPKRFETLKGKDISLGFDYSNWESRLKIAGAKNNEIVYSAWGARWNSFGCTLFTSADRAVVIQMFQNYISALTGCLAGIGYTHSERGGYTKALLDYMKSIGYMNDENCPVDFSRINHKDYCFSVTSVHDGHLILDSTKPAVILHIDSNYKQSGEYNVALGMYIEGR